MNHQHIFKQGNPERPLLLLLHGTGGTEHDLFFLGEAIDPEASLLARKRDRIRNEPLFPSFGRRCIRRK